MERKGDFISTNIRYKKETEVVTFQGKEIMLENLSPVFTPEQEAAKRRELEQQLYEVWTCQYPYRPKVQGMKESGGFAALAPLQQLL